MRIALINVSGRLSFDGSRLITALLKRRGHSVKTVFLGRNDPLTYQQNELELLNEILKDIDLVLVSVISSFMIRAVKVTDFVHKRYPGMKVIWGGPHCISAPELSLRYADGVCFSEGDEVVIDMVNKMDAGEDYTNTPNMAFNLNGSHMINDLLPLFSDLDSLPYPDFDLNDQFLLDRQLSFLTKAMLKDYFVRYPFGVPTLCFITTRGCPLQCSFCNNSRYIAMYKKNQIRYHGISYVINMLEQTLKNLDFFQKIAFGDDDFLIRPYQQLVDFADQYKNKIRLPFAIAASPNTYKKEKIEILLDAGLKVIQIGVQSGSQRVLDEVYNRKIKLSKTNHIIHQIEPYQETHGLNLILDFITDNPYETRDDLIQTYRYLINVPSKARINLYFLSFFPGTPIYKRALQDGLIEPFGENTYRFYTYQPQIKYQKNYDTFLIFFIGLLNRRHLLKYFPRFILSIIGSSSIRRIASFFPESFYAFLFNIVLKITKAIQRMA